MAHALIYRPRHRWRAAVAFTAAALIHVAAVGLASMQHQRIDEVQTIGGPEVTLDPSPPANDPPPPPDEIPPPPPPPPPNPVDPAFVEDQSTPPPVRRQPTKSVAPLPRPTNNTSGVTTLTSAKVFAINAPRPEYPYEARRRKITGSGVVTMTIDPITGAVTDVSLSQSTGSPYLDNAATVAFRKWRFKPGTTARVRCPITFTLMGASY